MHSVRAQELSPGLWWWETKQPGLDGRGRRRRPRLGAGGLLVRARGLDRADLPLARAERTSDRRESRRHGVRAAAAGPPRRRFRRADVRGRATRFPSASRSSRAPSRSTWCSGSPPVMRSAPEHADRPRPRARVARGLRRAATATRRAARGRCVPCSTCPSSTCCPRTAGPRTRLRSSAHSLRFCSMTVRSGGEVAVFVTRRNRSEVLVVHRSPTQGSYWHVVAGGIEPGESASEAAERELRRRPVWSPRSWRGQGHRVRLPADRGAR